MTEPPRSRVTAEQLRVRLVAEADVPLLATFTCGEPDLDDFLRSDALRLQSHRVVRTYLAFHETVLVGYIRCSRTLSFSRPRRESGSRSAATTTPSCRR